MKMIWEILVNPDKISIGITSDNGGLKCAVVKKYADLSNKALFFSDRFPLWLQFLMPPVIHTESADIAVYYVNDFIGDTDPDTWIDLNEERIIPKGFSSKDVLVEYQYSEKNIYAACMTKKDMGAFLEGNCGRYANLSMQPSLSGLATLYFSILKTPFAIWKCSSSGSVVVYSENGLISRYVNAWPDSGDLTSEPLDCFEYIESVVKLITDNKKVPVIMAGMRETDLNTKPCGMFIFPPNVNGVPVSFHEVYSIACNNSGEMNFIPFERVQKLKQTVSNWIESLKWIRRLGLIGIASLMILVISYGGVEIFAKVKNDELAEIRSKALSIADTRKTRDSLVNVIRSSGRFSGKESVLTILVNEMQMFFPEGMWADEIDIREIGGNEWQVSIVAMAKSTGLLGTFMKKLSEADRLKNIRMVYSEQVKMKNGEKINKCRVECIWARDIAKATSSLGCENKGIRGFNE